MAAKSLEGQLTILVAQVLVEVDLSVVPVTALSAETGLEDVVVLDADVLGRKVERHGCRRGVLVEEGWGVCVLVGAVGSGFGFVSRAGEERKRRRRSGGRSYVARSPSQGQHDTTHEARAEAAQAQGPGAPPSGQGMKLVGTGSSSQTTPLTPWPSPHTPARGSTSPLRSRRAPGMRHGWRQVPRSSEPLDAAPCEAGAVLAQCQSRTWTVEIAGRTHLLHQPQCRCGEG